MRRTWGAGLAASTLVAGLAVLVVPAAVGQTGGAGPAPRPAAAADQKDDAEPDDAEEDGAGGPPSWAGAHAQGGKHGRGADKAWKQAWHRLTPAQKEARMAALVREHEQGMRTWTACVAGAGSDAAGRGKCVKPLPPGLARKLP